MESKRPERVADLIQREVAQMLYRTVKDPRLGEVTITGVELSPDLKNARVFYVFRGSDEGKEKVAEGLARAKGFIRRELGKRLHLRYAPNLDFHFDASFEYGAKIEQLLKKLHDDE